jgi:hypothetical protein
MSITLNYPPLCLWIVSFMLVILLNYSDTTTCILFTNKAGLKYQNVKIPLTLQTNSEAITTVCNATFDTDLDISFHT